MSAKPPPRVTFDTSALAPEHRLDAWRGILGLTHEIEGAAHGFHARLTSTALGPMLASEMSAAPQSVARSLPRVRRDGLDHVVLHLTSSAFGVESGDARFRVAPGAITVNTLSRPFRRTASPEQGSLILSLPRDLVANALPDPEVFHGRVLQSGFGLLLGEHMRTLVRHAPAVTAPEMEGLARATAQLLAAGLEPTRRHISEARAGLHAAAMVRCRRYVDRHLASPELTPEAICRAVGLSRSTLYRLFGEGGGIVAYIRDRRLRAARDALSVANRPRVSEVAYRFGFTDPAAFSRAFRAAYGYSPKETLDDGPIGREQDIFEAWISAVSQDAG